MSNYTMNKTFCGFITIVGKPNVGKSTLLNKLCGQKISIISKKPQTTRHRITAIKTIENKQLVFIDTPGLHRQPLHKINRLMIKSALSAMKDIDACVFVINPKTWDGDDELIMKRLAKLNSPIIIAINKIDRVKVKDELLPLMQDIQEKCQAFGVSTKAVIPISAKHGQGVAELESLLTEYLPESPLMFPKDQITDRNEQFLAAELIREKLMRFLGDEVPHSTTVEIEKFKLEKGKKSILHISAIIWVEREGQKKIILGSKGEGLKHMATLARTDLEKAFNQKVFLQVWIKVKKGWLDNAVILKNLGYGD